MARIRASLLASAVLGTALALHAQQPAKPAAATPAAQAPAGSTHAVVRGETLWSLAKQFLGDAYLWPEIYRLNTAVIEDPHWIYPGEVLRLPAGVAVARAPATAAGTPVPAYDPGNATIFDPRRYKQARRERAGTTLMASHYAVRSGQYLAAPFIWAVGGPAGAGRVISSATSQIVTPSHAERSHQSQEPLFVRLPVGAKRANGERFMTYELGPVLGAQGQVVIVTGVVELRNDTGTGDARVVIVNQFASIIEGQGLTQVDSLVPRRDVMPSALDNGMRTTLAWMNGDPVIPQIGSYLVLSSGAKDGLVSGDQVTLFASLGKGEAGEQRAPEVAAVAQVMRVTPFGASAIILNRTQANVVVGMPGRITAKMP